MITTCEERLRIIFADYIYDYNFPSYSIKTQNRFELVSYSTWAVEELLNYILQHNPSNPIPAIKSFINKMNKFSNNNPKTSKAFSLARYIAMDVLDMFLAME